MKGRRGRMNVVKGCYIRRGKNLETKDGISRLRRKGRLLCESSQLMGVRY